jgi:PAS domain S-box-containing protein
VQIFGLGKLMADMTSQPSPALVLIVDDDPATRLWLQKALEADGHQTAQAEHGARALDLCQQLHPNLVLLDAVMPIMDGFETCARLQALPDADRMPVLIVTALDNPESVERAFTAGATDYITKPIHWPVLRQRVRRLLQSKRAEEALYKAQGELETRVEGRTAELARINALLKEEIAAREQSEKWQESLINGLRAVVAVADELMASPDVDTLFRRAVELARERFSLERCSIWLDDEDGTRGTYGTDRFGHTTDERTARQSQGSAEVESLRSLGPTGPHWVLLEQPLLSWEGKDFVQYSDGWVAHSPIKSANKVIGFFSNDAGISHTPVDLAKQEIVAVFCSLLGGIIERKQAEEAVRETRDKLEMRVRERTAELEQVNSALQKEIVERVYAEETLKEERNVLRTLIDSLPDYIFVKDAEGRYTVSNLAHARAVHASTPDDLVGKTSFDFFPPHLAAQHEADDRAILQSEQPLVNVERRTINADGQEIWVLTTKVPLRDRHGQIAGLVGVSRDISERKQAEETLKNERNLLRTLIDSLPDFIFTKDPAGRYTMSNLAHARAVHVPAPDDMVGKTVSDYFPPYLAAQYQADDQAVLQSEQPLIDAERRSINADGQEIWMLTTKVPLRDRHGKIIGLVAVARDVSERKRAEQELAVYRSQLEQLVDERTAELTAVNETLQAEIAERKRADEALRENEQQLRRITDNMLDMICQIDMDGTIEYASPSCWEVLGYMPQALIGQSIYARVAPDDLEYVRAAIQTTGRLEYRYCHADGQYLWLETLCNLLYESSSEPVGIILASRNITARKQAERELLELNHLKTDFLSTAAHELRTPLTSIRGFTELLLTRESSPERRKHYLTLINEEAEQLGQLIDDLLDVSRLEARRSLAVTFEPVNMGDLMTQAAKPFSESSPIHTIQIEGLAACPPVKGDPFRLAEVVKNLLSNAVKYSPQGGPITVRGHVVDNFLEISVEDKGIGMTPEQLAHLFEKFYRADASNTAIAGTGLGLSITKLIVELHGGQIWVESQYGVGSMFYFTLPLAAPVPT